MKWMIASDIHGSAYYCRKLIDMFEKENADRLLLLGDLLYHGPRNDLPKEYAPKEVIKMLNGIKNNIFCVRGNCEAEVDQMVLEFPVLADYAIIDFGNFAMFATHGHIFNEKNLPPIKRGDLLINGHTHIPVCETVDGILHLNPGSVSIPKDTSCNSYMTFEENVFLWHNIDGEVYNKYCINNFRE